MKKAIVCLLCALLMLVLAEPHVYSGVTTALRSAAGRQEQDAQTEQTTQAQKPSAAEQLDSTGRTDMLDITLYYRFGDTELLGAQQAQLDLRREETVASSIVQRLVDGPGAANARLSGLFPQGTEVISVSGNGATAFVTLSSAFFGRPDGAPADWEDSPEWQKEAALRRRLAVQSIVLSLTEEGRYQRVQLYTADGDDDVPQRIPLAWFDVEVTDPSLVLAASPRDEQAMLTPQRAMEMILRAWQGREWATLYMMLDPSQDEPLPTRSVFEAEMEELDISLLTYETTTGTVSFDGQSVTVVLTAEIRSRTGGDAQIVRESVPLYRVQDNWAMRLETLLSLMIRD